MYIMVYYFLNQSYFVSEKLLVHKPIPARPEVDEFAEKLS